MPEVPDRRIDFLNVDNGPITLKIAVAGQGPLILCIHGWPAIWYSWRQQLEHFAARGYRVAALDVRGYGGSSKPPGIADYTMRELASDVAAIIDRLGGGKAIVFGHDWGAPISWTTAQLHPGRVSAVALLSIPYVPLGGMSFIDMMQALYHDRFFYQLYFQREGVAEAELEADPRTALRKIYFAWSGSAPAGLWSARKPPDAKLLDGLIDPHSLPAWMTEHDLDVYVEAFRAGGFRGPLNRYRAQDIDYAELKELIGKPLTQPSCFIAGDRDPMRSLIPGMDLYADPGVGCTDFRGSTILPGIGHWVQQEAPDETNAAMERFLATL
jgi:pimeloyl-ACP methyl ester carboxylesterase